AGLFEVGAGPQMHPRAATVALLAVEAYADSGGSAPEMIRACYVRAPDAVLPSGVFSNVLK
ncbi:MAG: hypothetical protein GY868_06330, partial [Deltaproteobacteria bacterium]|nr:hypothetical protein [Deltaproteobacteria bacterium]